MPREFTLIDYAPAAGERLSVAVCRRHLPANFELLPPPVQKAAGKAVLEQYWPKAIASNRRPPIRRPIPRPPHRPRRGRLKEWVAAWWLHLVSTRAS
ncbi:MAG: hypothetical protein AAF790_09080 [Planctomycetota bacterium]